MAKSAPKRFVGVDGEAIEDRYVLFAAGAESLYDAGGLDLGRVLDWLALRSEGALFVGFAFHYDICMLVKDWPDEHIVRLIKGEEVRRDGWIIQHFPRHVTRATRYGNTGYCKIELFDVWGFFQSSFEAALDKIGIGTTEDIRWGKQARASFKTEDLARIQRYNTDECITLALMCERLRESMTTQNISIRSWHGPGAIADAVLKKAGVRDELWHPSQDMLDIFKCAYFGGRIEVLQIGYFEEVTLYDINSAYPAACCDLWDQRSAEWRSARRWRPSPYSVWHVEWNVPGSFVGPLPFRTEDGRIFFPARGRGWYWQPEVETALRLHPGSIKVLGGWVTKASRSTIRSTVDALYARRQTLKRDGRDVEAHVVKLALNSLYGKMAQSVGKAPWQSPAWAGYVTSWTRARLREVVEGHEHDVIGFSTDGVLIRGVGRLPVRLSPRLGDWKREEGYRGWVLGSGIYALTNGTETRKGDRGGRFDWPDAISQINTHGYARLWDTLFIAPYLAIRNPNAFGPYRARWMRRSRTMAPWRDPNAKRGYEHMSILDWNRDSCTSTILDGWGQEDSAPFDTEWRGGAGSIQSGLLLTPDQT